MISGLLFIAIIVSCKPKSKFDVTDKMLTNVPDSVLAVDTMIAIMTDIHLAEAWAADNHPDSLNQDEQLKKYYAEIFAKHHIHALQYRSSYNYYTNEPVIMNHIYTKITERLNLLESENLNVSKSKKNE